MSNFSGHGFNRIASSATNAGRVIWSLLTVVSTIFCLFFLLTSCQQYFDFSVVTTIKVNKLNEITFPAITFCNWLENVTLANFLDYRFQIKYEKNSILAEEIRMFYFGQYLTCVRFNGKKIASDFSLLKADKNGWEYGFYFLIHSKTLDFYVSDNTYEPCFSNFKASINQKLLTILFMSKTVKKDLGSPYSKCIANGEYFDSDLFKETISSGKHTIINKCNQLFLLGL